MSNFNHFKRSTDAVEYGDLVKLGSKPGVYRITNIVTGRVYIGSSIDPSKRISKHLSELKFNRHTNKRLQTDFNELGIKSFTYDLIEVCDNILDREKHHQLLVGIDNLYNDKIAGEYINEELRNIYSNTSKETHKTIEYRNKMSKLKTKYRVAMLKLTSDGWVIVETFNSANDVVLTYPDYKPNVIRTVCKGNKASYKARLWRYIDEDNNIITPK